MAPPAPGFGMGSSHENGSGIGEDSIPRLLWKEILEIGRRRNDQILRVMEEEVETSLFLPLQYTNHNKWPHLLLLHLKIDFYRLE